MLQAAEHLQFQFKAAQNVAAEHTRPDYLERHHPARGLLLGPIHRAHAAFPEDPQNAIGADGFRPSRMLFQQVRGQTGGWGFQKFAARAVGCQQAFHFAAERRLPGARVVEEPGLLGWRQGRRVQVEALNFAPAVRGHGRFREAIQASLGFPIPSSRASQARAACQSRVTVTGETPKASEVSAMLKPPK